MNELQLYCDDCLVITQWFKRRGDNYWIYECNHCGNYRPELNEYECPKCGYFDEDEAGIIKQTSFGPASGEYNIQEWDETRRCPICTTVHTFTNASG